MNMMIWLLSMTNMTKIIRHAITVNSDASTLNIERTCYQIEAVMPND